MGPDLLSRDALAVGSLGQARDSVDLVEHP